MAALDAVFNRLPVFVFTPSVFTSHHRGRVSSHLRVKTASPHEAIHLGITVIDRSIDAAISGVNPNLFPGGEIL